MSPFEKKVVDPATMGATSAVYGVVYAQSCYHSSPNCTRITSRGKGGADTGLTVPYENAGAARKAGHFRPCERCLGNLVFKIDGKHVRVTPEQLEVLTWICDIYSYNGCGLTLKEAAFVSKRTVGTIYVHMRNLVAKGLLQRGKSKAGKNAAAGSIRPTDLALRVIEESEKK